MNPHDDLDQRITKALDHGPDVVIPADFAARVASQHVAPTVPRSAFRYVYARAFALLCAVLLFLSLMMLFANRQTGLTLLEILLTSELAVITLVLSLRRRPA